jgi:hypothetical protein
MRAIVWVMVAIAGSLAGHELARAADAPGLVVPGKLGVPVIINGYDASYCVVEGDWGLDRPTGVPPTIVSCPLRGPTPVRQDGGYFPGEGEEHGYGRLEIEPPANRRLPPPAPKFHRSWGIQSEATPATIESPASSIPLIVAPQINGRKQAARQHRNR